MEIINRKAKFDYFIEDEYEAGIVLTGTEIKSIRAGHCNLKDSYGIVKNGEVIDSANGLLDEEGYVKLFKDNGFIK